MVIFYQRDDGFVIDFGPTCFQGGDRAPRFFFLEKIELKRPPEPLSMSRGVRELSVSYKNSDPQEMAIFHQRNDGFMVDFWPNMVTHIPWFNFF